MHFQLVFIPSDNAVLLHKFLSMCLLALSSSLSLNATFMKQQQHSTGCSLWWLWNSYWMVFIVGGECRRPTGCIIHH